MAEPERRVACVCPKCGYRTAPTTKPCREFEECPKCGHPTLRPRPKTPNLQ